MRSLKDKMIRAWSFVGYGNEQRGGIRNSLDNFHQDRELWWVGRLTWGWDQLHSGICGFELSECSV